MLAKVIKYEDFDGTPREEAFYFHLTKTELLKMDLSVDGGLQKRLQSIVDAKDGNAIMQQMSDIIRKSYGQKSPDGKRFIKSEQLADEFEQSAAYDVLFMELCTNEQAAIDFITGVMPADLQVAAKSANDNAVTNTVTNALPNAL